jgi:Ser/Thr protein kinase RdoA (MazF antagonist)
MQSRPPELSDTLVTAAVSAHWPVSATNATHVRVGYGSHHWTVEDSEGGRWFVSVDELADAEPRVSFARVQAALNVAAQARDAGLAFVVAPVRTDDGELLRALSTRYALALYPYVNGRSGQFHDRLRTAEAVELTGMLVSLHSLPPVAVATIGTDTYTLPRRAALEAALSAAARGEGAGGRGPYATRVRSLLELNANHIARVLHEHDALLSTAPTKPDGLVVTHGEPHPGNLIRTTSGLALIDWDTALLAPPERDLWLLQARTTHDVIAEYEERSGRRVEATLMTRYRLAWALADVAEFAVLLTNADVETADTASAWNALAGTVSDLATTPQLQVPPKPSEPRSFC